MRWSTECEGWGVGYLAVRADHYGGAERLHQRAAHLPAGANHQHAPPRRCIVGGNGPAECLPLQELGSVLVLRNRHTGIRVSGFGLRGPDFGFRGPGFGLQGLGFGFRGLGFGFGFSGSGLGFRV